MQPSELDVNQGVGLSITMVVLAIQIKRVLPDMNKLSLRMRTLPQIKLTNG